ncbi:MAG: hypothetical protein IT288_14645 [Bdellovibrionales bacterium]|nr:hypothetical protein [Bdellovibrionales bacterium]
MDAFKKIDKEEIPSQEPKIVAEFRIVPTANPREAFLEDYHHCCLCGSELIFTHNTNFLTLEVKEEAFCSACNIRTKQDQHRLQ